MKKLIGLLDKRGQKINCKFSQTLPNLDILSAHNVTLFGAFYLTRADSNHLVIHSKNDSNDSFWKPDRPHT